MFLDAIGISIIDDVNGENIIFVVISAIMVVCIISIIVYLKIKRGRKLKNEKY